MANSQNHEKTASHRAGQRSKNCWIGLRICRNSTPFNFQLLVLLQEIARENSGILLDKSLTSGVEVCQLVCQKFLSKVCTYRAQVDDYHVAIDCLGYWHNQFCSSIACKELKQKLEGSSPMKVLDLSCDGFFPPFDTIKSFVMGFFSISTLSNLILGDHTSATFHQGLMIHDVGNFLYFFW